jgi:flagellar biosynthesis/type III secretory pathway protein FliH
MSDAKTAKPVQFPVANEGAAKRPTWLEDSHAASVRKLFQQASDESRPALSEMPPANTNASIPPAAPAQAAAPQPQPAQRAQPQPQPQQAPQPTAADPNLAAQRAAQQSAAQRAVEAAAARSEHTDHDEPAQDERAYSKLPPPPLIPGARSAPPMAAANDVGVELLHEQREAFTNAALELAIARTATLSVLEGQLLDLSIEIAESLIEREIEHHPELHSTLVRAALASLGDADRVTLRTSPDAFEAICQQLGGPETTVNGVHVTVHADDTIPGLGCIVDGESVRIDATVAERLRAVRRAFEDERRKVAESNE